LEKVDLAKLAAALLEDIERGSLHVDLLVAKALTLARIVGDDVAVEWLTFEANGYDSLSAAAKKYALLTKRWDGESETRYAASAPAIVHSITTMTHSLEVEKQLQPSGEYALVQQQAKREQVHSWAKALSPLELIISSIKLQIHLFAARVFVEAQFSETSRSIFDRYQADVDRKLAKMAADAFEKLPYVFERLQNGESEAISHALTSSRRIIDSFANAVFPPRNDPVVIDGVDVDCGADKVKNRLRALMAERIQSKSRRDRLNKNLGALYDRVSAGVHADVSIDEAQALVLNTYLLLGELASVK
jgi:hypothetical protein